MSKLKKLRRRLLLQYLLTVGLLIAGAELSLYCLFGWAGQRELDTALRKDIERLASSVEIEEDGGIEFEGGLAEHVERERGSGEFRLFDRMSNWQILAEDGSTLARSRNAFNQNADLPAVGGDEFPRGELRFADEGSGRVRCARLRNGPAAARARQAKEGCFARDRV